MTGPHRPREGSSHKRCLPSRGTVGTVMQSQKSLKRVRAMSADDLNIGQEKNYFFLLILVFLKAALAIRAPNP